MCSEDAQRAILECLQRIEANTDTFDTGYEPLGIITVGGAAGQYVIKSPVNTECEWQLLSVNTTQGTGVGFSVSPSNSGALAPVKNAVTYGASGYTDNNGFEGIAGFLTFNYQLSYPVWLPLGRSLNLYFVTGVQAGDSMLASIAFRRLNTRYIPAPPRPKAHTHSQPYSRRGERTFMAGWEAQYPNHPYEHELIPESNDPATVGNVENTPTPAQITLAKLRGRGGVY